MVNFSVCIIAKNEEECIGDCLESIKDAPDIIVVDTGSTDKTKEIASAYTSKIYDFPWLDNFAMAHNFADTRGKYRWKLYIDADEKLCTPIERVHELCTRANNERIYSYDVKLTTSDRSEHWWHPRLYRRYVDTWWVGAVHPTLNVSQRNPCDIEIEYGRSVNHDRDPLRTRRILLKEISENPYLVREKFYLGREFANDGEWEQAIHWLESFVQDDYLPEYKAEASLLLCKIYKHFNMECKAVRYCQDATGLLPEFKEAWELRYLFSGEPEHKKRSEEATNEGVLFVRNRSWLKKHS